MENLSLMSFMPIMQGILQSQGRILRKMRFMPSSLSSNSHRLLTALVDSRHKKVYKVKNCITDIDPEREKEEKEKVVLKKLMSCDSYWALWISNFHFFCSLFFGLSFCRLWVKQSELINFLTESGRRWIESIHKQWTGGANCPLDSWRKHWMRSALSICFLYNIFPLFFFPFYSRLAWKILDIFVICNVYFLSCPLIS